jgi:hypothetical protein
MYVNQTLLSGQTASLWEVIKERKRGGGGGRECIQVSSHVHIDMCAGSCPVCMGLLRLELTPLRQGFSQNLERGWQSISSGNPLVSTSSHSPGVADI